MESPILGQRIRDGNPINTLDETRPRWIQSSLVFLLVLWILSVTISLVATYLSSGFYSIEKGDEREYYALANAIYRDGSFPSIFRTPVYPALLAIVFRITGPSIAVGKIVNCLVGGLTPVGIYLLCKILFDQRRAVLSGLIATVQPTIFYVNTTLYSESLSSAAFVWTNVFIAYLFTKAQASQHEPPFLRWEESLSIGMVLGWLVFTKPQHVFFLPFVLIAAGWCFRSQWVVFGKVCALSLLGVCLVLSAWWMRNAVVTGHFVPLTTSGDRTLIDANNPTIAHMKRKAVLIDGRQTWVGPGKFLYHLEDNDLIDIAAIERMSEVERARYFRRKAIGWIVANPVDWGLLCLKKLAYGFSIWPLWQGVRVTVFLVVPFLALLTLSIPGWWNIIRTPGIHRLLILHLGTFMTVTAFFFGSWRYRNPFEGSFIIVSVVGLTSILRKMGIRGIGRGFAPFPAPASVGKRQGSNGYDVRQA